MRAENQLAISVDLGENEREPSGFLECIVLSEKMGFDAAWLGDHFLPWIHNGGRSSSVWPLIGAALQSTKKILVGPLVATPIGGRYHPATLAQSSATVDSMFPGRLILSVGTGEAVNEFPFLGHWPDWHERIERLSEGVELMKKLWKSPSYFDFDGKFFKMKQVFLYTKPKTNLEVYFSALGKGSARYAGKYGDHLLTLSQECSLEKCKEEIFPSFERGAKDAGKNPGKMNKVVSLGFTLDDQENFLKASRQTAATNSWDETDPRKIESMGPSVSDDKILRTTYFCSDWDDVVDLISKFQEAGATHIILQPGANEERIKEYGERILKHFRT